MSLSRSEEQGQDGATTTAPPPTPQKKSCFFYVIIPPEDQATSNDSSRVITSTTELTAIMKRNPGARFQSGTTPEEAEKKAQDRIQFSKEAESIPKQKIEEPAKKRGRQSFSAVEESIGVPALESPKTGELLLTGREILTKQNEKVFERIAKNPRILCTDTEFPTILQEGCKYNAVHLAAKGNNFQVLNRVLDMVSCIDFLRQIYPKQTEEGLRSSCKHLAFSYLNNPDKMMQETPLHFACKFNCVECVDLLLSHPFCDSTLKNFENRTAFQLIGDRDSTTGPKAKAIKQMFTDRYIVPIWRDISVDGEAPVLGKVSFIQELGSDIPHPLLHAKFPNLSLSLLKPCKSDLAPDDNKLNESHVRVFACHPSNWRIRAYAGPMTEAKAKEFRKVMKRSRGLLFEFGSPDNSFNLSGNCISPQISPPCSPENSLPFSNLLLSPLRSPNSPRPRFDSSVVYSPLKAGIDLRVRDVEKGLERIALEYCIELEVPFSEYWLFLQAFCDLSTEAGIELLEAHFHKVEAEKREAEMEELITSATSIGNTDLDDVIDRFQELKLNSSGICSPKRDSEGYCTNPRCRMNSRFCNCAEVVPAIPYEDADYSWMYEKLDNVFRGIVPLCNKDIREPKPNSSSDSFNFSFSTQDEEFEFQFEWPDAIVDEYKTAPSSPVDNDVYEDCNNSNIFLSGDGRPGKFDYQVFLLLKDFNKCVDSNKHLKTFQWLNSMRAHGDTQGQRRSLNESAYLPRRLWEPSFVSTPCRKLDIQEDEDEFNKSF